MKKTISKLFLLAILGGAVSSTSAQTSVTLPSFVSKGDVQSFYGGNNQRFQSYAPNVDFRYNQIFEHTWSCVRTNRRGTDRTSERATSQRVTASITTLSRDARTGQINGFNLQTGTMRDILSGVTLGACPSGGYVLDTTTGNSSVPGVTTTEVGRGFEISRVSNPNPSNDGWSVFTPVNSTL